jgi:hypothetical protein
MLGWRHPDGRSRYSPGVSARDCATGSASRSIWRRCVSRIPTTKHETTLRRRRDEWVLAGIFGAVASEALEGYDRVVGLDLSEVVVDGSLHKAPPVGEGTGKNSTDRGKLGWKLSLATDAKGIRSLGARCCQPP